MIDWYRKFTIIYFRWYHRVSFSSDSRNYSPVFFLSICQTINLMCVDAYFLKIIPRIDNQVLNYIPFVSILLLFSGINKLMLNSFLNSENPKFGNPSDNVPSFKDFSIIYCYLGFTLGLMFIPLIVQ
jgi:hypothetical protein